MTLQSERIISMNTHSPVRPNSYLKLLILSLCLTDIGCGGSSYSPSPQPSPQPSPNPGANSMQGPWAIAFHSDVTPDSYTVLEANLSQAGTKVFAGATSALVYQGTTLGTTIPLTRRGSNCDSGGEGQVTFDGTLTNQQPTTEIVTFALTENGTLGSAVISASASTDGTKILDGTYTIPAACGFSEDHGTFQGYQESIKFSGLDTYYGSFQGVAITVQFTSGTGFGISATGTDNGAPFSLTGSTTGFSLALAGKISGQDVTWFALYDSTYNNFEIYDSDGKLVGGLQANNPWGY